MQPLKQCNSYVTTRTAAGKSLTTPLWITDIQFGSSVQFSDNQVLRGMSFQPVRREQQYINFTAIWSKQRYSEYYNFTQALRAHFVYSALGDAPEPMIFMYPAEKLTNYGWIESTDTGDQRWQVIYEKQYTFRIVTSQLQPGATVISGASQFIPTRNGVTEYGTGWYTIKPPAKKPVTNSSNPPVVPGRPGGVRP